MYVVGSEPAAELDESKTDDEDYYDNGTYTNRNFDEEGSFYISKQFDWEDAPTKSKGVITLKTRLNVSIEPRTAVYAFTPCGAHGFSKQIAQENIEFLLNNYD